MKSALAKELLLWTAVALLCLWAQVPVFGQWCIIRCGDGSAGSGAIVDANDGKGLVITAHHVVRDVMSGQQQTNFVRCDFGGQTQYEARIVSIDPQHDLCALLITEPNEVKPVRLAAYTGQGTHTVYGFPGAGPLRPVSGQIVDDSRFTFTPGDYGIALLNKPTVGGQSGGAVVTDAGMVGIMWGCDSDGCANMTCGQPFDEFMVSLTQSYSCYGGRCWQPSPNYSPGGRVIISGPTKPIQSTPQPKPASYTDPQWVAWRDKIQAQLDAIKQCNCDHSQQVTIEQVNQAIATAVAKIEAKPGPIGPQGPQGPPGKDAAAKPFYLRVHPSAPYQSVSPGQYVTLPLDKVQAQQ